MLDDVAHGVDAAGVVVHARVPTLEVEAGLLVRTVVARDADGAALALGVAVVALGTGAGAHAAVRIADGVDTAGVRIARGQILHDRLEDDAAVVAVSCVAVVALAPGTVVAHRTCSIGHFNHEVPRIITRSN